MVLAVEDDAGLADDEEDEDEEAGAVEEDVALFLF